MVFDDIYSVSLVFQIKSVIIAALLFDKQYKVKETWPQ